MPCFGALLAQIQAKVKFLQILDCHFLGVKSLFLITKFIFKVIPCSFMKLKLVPYAFSKSHVFSFL